MKLNELKQHRTDLRTFLNEGRVGLKKNNRKLNHTELRNIAFYIEDVSSEIRVQEEMNAETSNTFVSRVIGF